MIDPGLHFSEAEMRYLEGLFGKFLVTYQKVIDKVTRKFDKLRYSHKNRCKADKYRDDFNELTGQDRARKEEIFNGMIELRKKYQFLKEHTIEELMVADEVDDLQLRKQEVKNLLEEKYDWKSEYVFKN